MDQTLKPDRFVVIDNASTDESYLIAEEMDVEIVWADNRCQFITGLNTAMSLNKDLLFFMQNDVVLDKNCLKEMRSVHGNGFIAQPVIYQTDGEIDNAGMDMYWPGFGQRRSNKWWKDQSPHACGLVSTICFFTDLKNERYSEVFAPAYYEDLSFKLEYPNVRHLLIPSAKAIHRGNHTFSQTLKKRQISDICRKNRKKLINKHYSGLDWLIRTTVLSLLDIAKETFDVITDWGISLNNRKKIRV